MSWASPNVLIALFARGTTGEQPSKHVAVRGTRIPRAFRGVKPYLAGICAVLVVVALIVAIYFTWHDWQWSTFLGGMLAAAILSLASRSARAEWLIARRTAQLAQARQKLATETHIRLRAEEDLACIEKNTIYLHESMPAMLAYLDRTGYVQYHNRAFREGIGNTVSKIDERHLRDVVGSAVHAELEADVAGALGGAVLHRERMHKDKSGKVSRLLMLYLPEFDSAGEVAGVFMLSSDITVPEDVALLDVPPVEKLVVVPAAQPAPAIDTDSAEGDDDDVARLRHALACDEFYLFFQAIKPVVDDGTARPFREILLRLKREEESMMPPGSFLPLAEKLGMLPDLDRWVVRHLLGWICADASRQHATYSVNISAQTLADITFPAFVRTALADFGLAGSLLCFELMETDVQAHTIDAFRFAEELRAAGCRHALCGFNGNRESFDLLRQVPFNFLKIDGGLVLNMLRSSVDLARIKAIHRVAHAVGITTVAECVEGDEILAKLRQIGVDMAQGFGIARPQDLRQIPVTAPVGQEKAAVNRQSDIAMAAE